MSPPTIASVVSAGEGHVAEREPVDAHDPHPRRDGDPVMVRGAERAHHHQVAERDDRVRLREAVEKLGLDP